MPKIVISYRRADDDAIVGRIRDKLAGHYGADSVFMDIDNIPFGVDFRKHIDDVLQEGEVVVAVMGPHWIGPVAGGKARIHDAGDPVRIEIETTLKRGIPVVPVLVNGAEMPKPADLPDVIRDLAFHNAAEVDSGRDFHQHMDRLIQSLDRGLGYRGHGATHGRGTRQQASWWPWLAAAGAVIVVAGGGWFVLASRTGQPASELRPVAATSAPVEQAPVAGSNERITASGETGNPPAMSHTAELPMPAASPPATTAAAPTEGRPTGGADKTTIASGTNGRPVETPPVAVAPEVQTPPVIVSSAPAGGSDQAMANAEPTAEGKTRGAGPSSGQDQTVAKVEMSAETVVTAVQNEKFSLCGQSYTLKISSVGAGIFLYPPGFLAKPIRVTESEPTKITDSCELTVTDIGDGLAPVVVMQYRAVGLGN